MVAYSFLEMISYTIAFGVAEAGRHLLRVIVRPPWRMPFNISLVDMGSALVIDLLRLRNHLASFVRFLYNRSGGMLAVRNTKQVTTRL
jgi:hypothetical protein